MRCNRKGCQNEATSSISVELRVHPDHEPATSTPLVYVCDKHAIEATWNELVSDEWFSKIGDEFEAKGYQRPVKKYCNLSISQLKTNDTKSPI